jgi:hypothetical protein
MGTYGLLPLKLLQQPHEEHKNDQKLNTVENYFRDSVRRAKKINSSSHQKIINQSYGKAACE